MAWTNPETFTAGQTLTAASMNAISGNLDAIGGAWTTFTPSWTNLTVGNGTESAAYVAAGQLYVVRYSLVIGSTSAVGSDPKMTLPNSSSFVSGMAYTGNQVGAATFLDTGTALYSGAVQSSTATTIRLRAFEASSTYLRAIGTIAATVPFTWATNDMLAFEFLYEAA